MELKILLQDQSRLNSRTQIELGLDKLSLSDNRNLCPVPFRYPDMTNLFGGLDQVDDKDDHDNTASSNTQ